MQGAVADIQKAGEQQLWRIGKLELASGLTLGEDVPDPIQVCSRAYSSRDASVAFQPVSTTWLVYRAAPATLTLTLHQSTHLLKAAHSLSTRVSTRRAECKLWRK